MLLKIFILSFFVTSVIIVTCQQVAKPKDQELTMLALVPNTPTGNVACQTAMQIAVDNVNAREDILPNYRIKPFYADEDSDVTGIGLRTFFNFINSQNESWLASPVIVGPLATTSCSTIASLEHLHGHTTQIAIGCGISSFSANRKLYPNLYRIGLSDESNIAAFVKFVTEFGQWSRAAIISDSMNNYDFQTAIQTEADMQKANVTVPFFNVNPAIDEYAFRSLKSANVRIVFVVITNFNIIFDMLCGMHRNGMTPSKGYVFVLRGPSVVNERGNVVNLSPGCTVAMVTEQMTGAFLVGTTISPVKNFNSSLGYDTAYFDRMLAEKVVIAAPNMKAQQMRNYYLRYKCHDTMVQAILALDNAEKKLNLRNLTLSQFREYPERIGKVVNQSVAESHFSTIRVGEMWYSKRLEPDFEPQYIKQWRVNTSGNGVVLYELEADRSTVIRQLLKVRDPIWMTLNGKRPNDSWKHVIMDTDVPLPLFAMVCMLALAGILAQVFCGVVSWRVRRDPLFSRSAPLSKYILLVGCILLDVGAIFQSTGGEDIPHVNQCNLRTVFFVIGLSCVHGFLLCKLLLSYYNKQHGSAMVFIKVHGLSSYSPGTPRKGPPVVPASPKENAANASKTDKFVVFGSGMFIIVNLIVLCVWLISDPLVAEIAELGALPVYDADRDAYIHYTTFKCYSESTVIFLSIIAALHALILAEGAILVYDLRTQVANNAVTELQASRLGLVNAATLCAATALILVIVNSPLAEQIILSLAAITISASTSLIVFFQSIRQTVNGS